MDDRSDERLVAACQDGDRLAYAILVKRHYRHVFAICIGMLGNIHDAEDIAQDAMLRGFAEINKLRRGEQFGAWIVRITRNSCIDFFRRQKRVRQVEGEKVAEARQTISENHALQEAVRRLPRELRMPLVMYYFGDKSAKDIAEKLNISRSGVCERIRSARKALHKLLTEEVNDEQ